MVINCYPVKLILDGCPALILILLVLIPVLDALVCWSGGGRITQQMSFQKPSCKNTRWLERLTGPGLPFFNLRDEALWVHRQHPPGQRFHRASDARLLSPSVKMPSLIRRETCGKKELNMTSKHSVSTFRPVSIRDTPR